MQKFRILMVFALVFSLVLGMGLVASAADDSVKIVLDGKVLAVDQAPRFEDNFTLIPVRAIGEALGGIVDYDNATKRVVIKTADHTLQMELNNRYAMVDGKSVAMDIPMRGFSGRTFVPARFVAESLGADVTYVSASKSVNIKYFSKMTGSLKISGSTTIQPVADGATIKLMDMNKGRLTVTVAGGGSGVGVKDAVAGTVNIGNSSAALTNAQKATYPKLVQTFIGSDAIAVILNKANPVKNLTKQQVFDIYTGKITNWKDVGGNDAPILVQVRESTSGTAASFFDLAIKAIDSKAKVPATFTPSISSGALAQAVMSNPNAIGYDSYGYIDPKTVHAVAVEGIDCTDNNVNAMIWPYTRSLVMLTQGTPTGLSAVFINYVRSTEGQKILTDNAYIELRNKYAATSK
jgi:phosphate transport system substrate-binding protein